MTTKLYSKMGICIISVVFTVIVISAVCFRFTGIHSDLVTRIDYKGNESMGSWAGSYTFLNGIMQKDIYPTKDVLNIQIETESGAIAVEIQDESGNIMFDEKNIGTNSFHVEVSGKVNVQIEAKEHKGSFRIGCISDALSPKELQPGQIFLYGEAHDTKSILEQELELWSIYYHDYGMRDLFIEYSYCGTGFFNLWMQSDNDDILEQLYQDFEGTLAHSRQVMDFFKQIKQKCPETVFHGTDIEFQYKTTGKRFLEYLENTNQEQTETYRLAQEAIEQGKYYVEHPQSGDLYRENMMVENFIREFDSLNGACIMGIYGFAHTDIEAMEFTTKAIPCMAGQLYDVYKDALHTDKLTISYTANTVQLGEKQYPALYYGAEDVTGNGSGSKSREIWRVENAYEDFIDNPVNGNVLSYDDYPPIEIETGQVFIVKLTQEDDFVVWQYYRSDGNKRMGSLVTEEFTIEWQ